MNLVDESTATGPGVDDPTVQLLVGDGGNRSALRSLLEPRYEVVTGEGLRPVDLFLVDVQTLPDYRDTLVEHKEAADPTFVPVVLIRREDTLVNVRLSADSELTIVDDQVTAPLDRGVLFRRLDNLLTRRQQSVELTRRYERTEARFEGLFRAIPDPAFVLGSGGCITEVNAAFCELIGADPVEVEGDSPTALDAFDGDGDRTLPDSDGETVTLTDVAGTERHVEVRQRTETVGGETTTVVVLHDVTELTETNRQLEEFAGFVSHDLRNPLNVATAYLSELESEVPEPAREHVDTIEGSLERADDIIEGVRTLVLRTDVEDPTVLHLVGVAREAWQNVDTADATLAVDGEAGLEVLGDPDRLLQLFENLFRNAVEHGEEDVTVSVGPLDDGGFYVADDGPGIPEERREEVFEAGVTTSADGTGLGLKIVGEIADAHGWQVAVTGSDAGGARFEFRSATG